MTESPVTPVSSTNPCALGEMKLYVKLRIDDQELLCSSAVDYVAPRLAPNASIEEVLLAVTNSPDDLPADNGYEQLPDTSVVRLDAENFMLMVSASVIDAQKLYDSACIVYAACWQDCSWTPQSSPEALYELVLASNSNPSPLDIGFEIIDWATTPFAA